MPQLVWGFFMFKTLLLLCVFLSVSAIAESKISVDVGIDKLTYVKPPKGVGKAGILIFKNANVTNNGIVLNVNNVNNYFDSEIFVRPTFLGFTTQFGNYGFAIDEKSIINSLNQTELQNSKLVLDDDQLNLSGEYFSFINPGLSVKVKNFRLYCQSMASSGMVDAPSNDMMKNCFNFLTLNGSYTQNNQAAFLEYEGFDKGDKMLAQVNVRSFDLRKNQINANLLSVKTVSNDSYIISANELNASCAKDEDLQSLDFEKIKKACFNQLKVAPVKISLVDQKQKSNFNLDIKDLTIKDKMAYFALNSGALSDTTSTTSINNLLLNCKKSEDTDLLDLTQVLQDCLTYGRVSIANVGSSKPDDKKDSAIKNIIISSTNGAAVIQAVVKFLGISAKVAIYGNIVLNEAQRKLIITVTDTKLPLGINSVKLVMYFLKKTIVSKDVQIQNNVITVSI